MNLTHSIFLFLLLTVNSVFFAMVVPQVSERITIKKIAFEERESTSLSAHSSGSSTLPSSAEASPKSRSPERRSWDRLELESVKQVFIDALPLLKTNNPQTEFKINQLLEEKLMELAHSMELEIAEIERIEITKNEERLVMKDAVYDYPGCAAKFCSLEEHRAAESAALVKYLALLEGQ